MKCLILQGIALYSFFVLFSGIALSQEKAMPAIVSLLLHTNGDNEKIPSIVPRDESFRPLQQQRFVPLSRQVEYLHIGPFYKNDGQHTFFAIDPLRYNFDPQEPGKERDEEEGDDDLLDVRSVVSFTDDQKKIAASGMLDNDIQDETAVLIWPEEGPGSLVVVNPLFRSAGGGPVY